jgi:hypothetical protein
LVVLSLSPVLKNILATIAEFLQMTGAKWLIGGSCGLQIGQIELQASPRDLDIYVDAKDVDIVFQALREFATDGPEFSQTVMYSSILSHFCMEGIQVEVVGDFEVHTKGSLYKVHAAYLQEHHASQMKLGGNTLFIMPLAHELLFNILRDRPDRYESIACVMLQNPEIHFQALKDLLKRNQWGDEVLIKLTQLFEGKTNNNYWDKSRG